MKSVVLFTLVALAAAGPMHNLPVVVSTPDKVVVVAETSPTTGFYAPGLYGFFGEQYGTQGKIFEVAQYIAYQFHLIQELGYTPSQVATYFLEHGFPEYVAYYLAQIYESGLSEPYFRSPYLIFQYYSQNGLPQEVQQYILREIVQALQLFQNYFLQYGPKAFEYEYPGVSPLISQYVVQLGRYYNGNGFTYSRAQVIYEQLRLVEQYALSAMRFLESGKVPVEIYQYVYSLLKESLMYIESAQSAYQTYQVYQQNYLPYYFAQYYSYQVGQVFQYFSKIYQYIQQYQGSLPPYFVEQIRLAYFALQKVYKIIYSFYGYGSYWPYISSYGYQYGPYSSTYGYGSYWPYISSYGYQYGPYSSTYGYGSYWPYISSYGYQYGPYSSTYGYGSYWPYISSYGYQYGPYSSSYGYGSYWPYISSYGYQYGPYSSTYGYGSYWPYSSSSYGYEYGPYSSSYGSGSYVPYGSSYGYQYGLYSGSYGLDSSYGYKYNPYSFSYGYLPYSSSYAKYGSYSPYMYLASKGYSSYPYAYYPYSSYSYQYAPYSSSYGFYGPYSSTYARYGGYPYAYSGSFGQISAAAA